MQYGSAVLDGLSAQPLFRHGVINLLNMRTAQSLQLDSADLRLDVILDTSLIVKICRRLDSYWRQRCRAIHQAIVRLSSFVVSDMYRGQFHGEWLSSACARRLACLRRCCGGSVFLCPGHCRRSRELPIDRQDGAGSACARRGARICFFLALLFPPAFVMIGGSRLPQFAALITVLGVPAPGTVFHLWYYARYL